MGTNVTHSQQAAGVGVQAAVARQAGVRQTDVSSAADSSRKPAGYGLPCAKCHLYYPADLDVCPTCKHKERVSPVVPKMPAKRVETAPDPIPDSTVLELEREEFLKQFKAQMLQAHAEVLDAPETVCKFGEHHPGRAGAGRNLSRMLRAAAGTAGCLRSRSAHRFERSSADRLRRGLGRLFRSEQDVSERRQRAAERTAQACRHYRHHGTIPAAGPLRIGFAPSAAIQP